MTERIDAHQALLELDKRASTVNIPHGEQRTALKNPVCLMSHRRVQPPGQVALPAYLLARPLCRINP